MRRSDSRVTVLRGLKWPGRHYHRVYGYPVRWAVLAEIAWRLEHARPSGPGYRWRKAFERRANG